MGSAVLITATMAGVSMTFALHIALGASISAALPFAIAWGLAIMSLDRWLVVSMSRKQLLLAIPRALLGLLFGVIISTPLTLQIFHTEIANQIIIDHTNAEAAYSTSSAVTKLTAVVTADQRTVANYQAVINSGGVGSSIPPEKDRTLAVLQKRLTAYQNQVTYYQNAAHCELYGGSGCSRFIQGNVAQGLGPAYTQDENLVNSYTDQVHLTQQQIDTEQSRLAQRNGANEKSAVSSASTDLAPALAKLTRDQSALNTLRDSYDTTLGQDTGVLASLQALDQLRVSSPVLFVAELLLFLFFTAIEWLPIGVKVLLSLGPENTYEKTLALAEQSSLEFAADVVPEIVHDTAEARLRRLRSKRASRTKFEQKEAVDVSQNGLARTGWTGYQL